MTKKRVGDVFEVRLDAVSKRFFQYVADDMSQLNSHVVRVFSEAPKAEEPLDLFRVATGNVEFHAHVFLNIGLKKQVWKKVGHADPPRMDDVLFRDTEDYGKQPLIEVSDNWYVWSINGPYKEVGSLSPNYESAEIGVVVPPSSLLYRIQNGKYDFVYPDWKHR